MLIVASGIDSKSYDDVKLPLSSDVKDPTAWDYPYLRLALATSMTSIGKDGLLHPERELTRADVALLMYRLQMYQQHKRTQDLLSTAENEIVTTMNDLDKEDLTHAEYASVRALLAARGAQTSSPTAGIVIAALKMTEAFRSLVRSYRALISNNAGNAITISKEAWTKAEEAKKLSPDLKALSTQVELSATSIAARARKLQKK
jgi:hypothetical protein